MIKLKEAAEKSLKDESEILKLAAEGKISLAAHSPSWAAIRGSLGPNGQFDGSEQGSVVLHDKWVYVNPPYLRALIDAEDPVEMGFWRSTADGPVDLFIKHPNKPRIQRRHLYIRPEDQGVLDIEPEDSGADRERALTEMVKQKYLPAGKVWEACEEWPHSEVTREFIRLCEEKIRPPGTPQLTVNAVKRIDTNARPPKVRAKHSHPGAGRKSKT